MSLPDFTMRQLIECGVHYGHQSHRWNPLMAEFIHSKRNGIHIIDLTKTIPLLDAALAAVFETVSKGGAILFVGTKRQAEKPIAEAASKSAQFYINQRWLGGTLTNWQTVSNSINRLKSIDGQLEGGVEGLTKKELLGLRREQAKLQASLGGIRDMKNLPDMLFVVDVKKEALAVSEAKKLGIPVVAIVDTNCSPDGVTYLVPGNDDASRAINLYCDLFSQAALAGVEREMSSKGADLGELETPVANEEISKGSEPNTDEVNQAAGQVDDAAKASAEPESTKASEASEPALSEAEASAEKPKTDDSEELGADQRPAKLESDAGEGADAAGASAEPKDTKDLEAPEPALAEAEASAEKPKTDDSEELGADQRPAKLESDAGEGADAAGASAEPKDTKDLEAPEPALAEAEASDGKSNTDDSEEMGAEQPPAGLEANAEEVADSAEASADPAGNVNTETSEPVVAEAKASDEKSGPTNSEEAGSESVPGEGQAEVEAGTDDEKAAAKL